NVAEPGALLEVDDGDGIVVLVGDIEDLAGRVLGKQFRIGTGGQGVVDLLGLGVDHLNGVVIADGDHHELAIAREFDAARPLADLDGGGDGPFVGIDDRNRVAFFVGNIGRVGPGGARRRQPQRRQGKQAPTPHAKTLRHHFSLHLVSGRSTPSVSSSETWCRKPSCGDTETTIRPSANRIGWRSCRFQSLIVNRWPLKAATEKSGRLMKSNTAFGSPEFVRDAASPTMRTAVHACMSSAVM